MNKKDNILIISAAVFTVVAALHLLRLITGFDLSVGGESISWWVSVFGVLATGYLAVANFRLLEKSDKKTWLKFLAWLIVIDGLVMFYSWIAGLSYWGFSAGTFGWIALFDLAVALFILRFVRKIS